MKVSRILSGAVLAGGLWTASAAAQVPAAPAAVDPAAAAAAKPGFCEKIEMKIDKKRRKLCTTPLGQMLNSITRPFSALSGGIIPSFCPSQPSKEDQQKPGAEGAAAQAMADAAAAKQRRQAVRILGTFDCHWHPEAEAGLVAALRTDRAECVRLEAAIALNRGCCCTRAIVEALEDCVAGTDKLGPSENSPRVQQIAAIALEHCLQCPEANPPIEDVVPPTPKVDPVEEDKSEDRRPDPSAEPAPQPRTVTDPVMRGSGKPSRALVERARHTLARYQSHPVIVDQGPIPPGQRSLAGLANYVTTGGRTAPTMVQTAPPAKAAPGIARVPATAPTVRVVPAAAEVAATAPGRSEPAAQLQPPAPVAPVAFIPPSEPDRTRAAAIPATAMPRAIDPTVRRCLDTLRDAADPEVRHAAVRTLVGFNWREHPEALAGLVYAARQDRHPGMRVACVRALAAMKAGTPEVVTGLQPMTRDADEWIRQETTQALAYLQTLLPPASNSLR